MNSINLMTKKWAENSKWDCHYIFETESTNTWAKSTFNPASKNSIFLTDHQAKGRGRNQNKWLNSNHGDCLLSTWAFSKSTFPSPVLPVRVGHSLFIALQTVWPQIPFALKAPNDIFIDQRKCAGILIETSTSTLSQIYIGLGINVLSSPQLNERSITSILEESQQSTIAFNQWSSFCNIWSELLVSAAFNNDTQLTNQESIALTTTLNIYYKNTVDRIQNDGSIIFKNGNTIPWHEL
jgi:BirA family transcriptional regulator, biotin operon repressor / biotin---[acetyl-CoA-carboxylase] ligase